MLLLLIWLIVVYSFCLFLLNTDQMADNFDPCECVFSHEGAMQRLISLVRYKIAVHTFFLVFIVIRNVINFAFKFAAAKFSRLLYYRRMLY